jgi:phthiocerol/phenolphthiocerol synthesis type-I polyketide synthase E
MTELPDNPSLSWHILTLAAHSLEQLETQTEKLRAYLQRYPEQSLADVAYAIRPHNQSPEHRRFLVCTDTTDVRFVLDQAASSRVFTGIAQQGKHQITFLFPGLGENYARMTWHIYQTEPIFRTSVDTCAVFLEPLLNCDIREVLYAQTNRTEKARLDLRRMLRVGDDTSGFSETLLAQPILFVIEYALASLWISWGVHPDYMLGYSLGEYVAACLAKVMELPDALRIISERARLIQTLPEGTMLAVALSEREVEAFLGEDLSLAAINGPQLCVVAGAPGPIADLQRRCYERSITTLRLPVSRAFHSNMMEAASSELVNILKTYSLHPPVLPFISNVTGTWITDQEASDPAYWSTHMCQSVRFAAGLQTLWGTSTNILLEVGPGQTLCTMAQQNAIPDRILPLALPSLPSAYEQTSDRARLLHTLGLLWLAGAQIDWEAFYAQSSLYHQELFIQGFDAHLRLSQQHRATPDLSIDQKLNEQTSSPQPKRGKKARPPLFTSYIAPAEALEQAIAALWEEALQIAPIGVHDNFFEIGGHSMIASRLATTIQERYRVSIPITLFFQYPTVTSFTHVLRDLLEPQGNQQAEDVS